jgi:SAM-dependent methyltransferase
MYRSSIYDIEWKYYDILYGNLIDDVEFYRSRLIGDSVLEIMCGTGRIISSFKNMKIRYGLDIDERMLSMMNSKDKDVVAIRGDARDFSIDRKFDNIIIGLNSILLFDRGEKIRVLKNASRHIKEGGIIFLDAIMPPELEEGIVYLGDYKVKGGLEIYRYFVPYFSDDMKILHIKYIYDIFEMGGYRRETADLQLFPVNYQDMRDIAREAGLRIKRVYGGYSGEKFYPEKSERMLLIMEKAKDHER